MNINVKNLLVICAIIIAGALTIGFIYFNEYKLDVLLQQKLPNSLNAIINKDIQPLNAKLEHLKTDLTAVSEEQQHLINQSVIEIVTQKLPKINLEIDKLLLLRSIGLLQEARLNCKYWDNPKFAISLIKSATEVLLNKTYQQQFDNDVQKLTAIVAALEQDFKIAELQPQDAVHPKAAILKKLQLLQDTLTQIVISGETDVITANIKNVAAPLHVNNNNNTKHENTNNSNNKTNTNNDSANDSNRDKYSRILHNIMTAQFWRDVAKSLGEQGKALFKLQNKHDKVQILNQVNAAIILERMQLNIETIKFSLISDNQQLYQDNLAVLLRLCEQWKTTRLANNQQQHEKNDNLTLPDTMITTIQELQKYVGINPAIVADLGVIIENLTSKANDYQG